jgi:hypothetical protein
MSSSSSRSSQAAARRAEGPPSMDAFKGGKCARDLARPRKYQAVFLALNQLESLT